jgi:ribosomal protein S18 acetylase RimI-like enzyme
VRPARVSDLPRVAALWQDLLEHHAALAASFALRPGARRRLERTLRAQLDDAHCVQLVWEEAGELCGWCNALVQTAPPLLVEQARAEITELWVRGDARGRGIGRALVEAIAARLRALGAERVEVRVAAANPSAQRFWRALGYADLVDVLERRL